MLRVNACVNMIGVVVLHDGRNLVWKLRYKTANEFAFQNKMVVEQRQLKWTTFSNLNLYFDTWEQLLVDLGFARRKKEGEGDDADKGSLVFFAEQKDQIINVDETSAFLDNTTGQTGGCPSWYFMPQE